MIIKLNLGMTKEYIVHVKSMGKSQYPLGMWKLKLNLLKYPCDSSYGAHNNSSDYLISRYVTCRD